MNKKTRTSKKTFGLVILGTQWDSNPRPLEPQSSALTN